jgi:hypothetical protein
MIIRRTRYEREDAASFKDCSARHFPHLEPENNLNYHMTGKHMGRNTHRVLSGAGVPMTTGMAMIPP